MEQLSTIHYLLSAATVLIFSISALLFCTGLLTSKTSAQQRRQQLIKSAYVILPFSIIMISAIPFSTILINYVTTQTHSPTITLRLDRSEHGRALIHAVYAKNKIITISSRQPIIMLAEQRIHIILKERYKASSWWKPSMNSTIKLPGNIRETWLQTNKARRYISHCGAICGQSFAKLKLKIKTETARQYKKWLNTI